MAGQAQDTDYWSSMLNTPMGQTALQRGMQAMQSGEISPADLPAAAKKMHPVLSAAGFGKKNPILDARPTTPNGARALMSSESDQMGGPMPGQGEQPGGMSSMPAPTNGAPNPAAMMKAAKGTLPTAQVAPEAKGSGLTQEQQFTQSMLENIHNQNKSEGKYLLTMDPEQLSKLYKDNSELPTFADQASGIDKQKELAGMAAHAPTDVFSGPIAGLLQSEFGRNTSEMAANTGQSPDDQRKNILNMSEKIQGNQKDLSKSIFDAIGKEKAGSFTESAANSTTLQDLVKAMSEAKAKDPLQNPRGTTSPDMKLKIFNAFQKEAGDDKKALEQSQNAVNTLQSGSFTGDAAVKALLARASSEVGRLSTFEQQMFLGNPSLAGQLNRAITKAETGRLDEADRADMLLLARTYEQFRKDSLNKKVDYFSSQVAPGVGLDAPSMKNMLLPQGGFGVPTNKVGPKRMPAPGSQAATDDPPVAVIMANGIKGKIPKSQLKQFLADGAGKVAP
jgi:hypothetical protein